MKPELISYSSSIESSALRNMFYSKNKFVYIYILLECNTNLFRGTKELVYSSKYPILFNQPSNKTDMRQGSQ